MKKNYFLAILAALIFVSCSKTDDPLIPISSDQNQSENLYKKDKSQDVQGTLTYNYTTDFDIDCNSCGAGYFSTGNYLGTGSLSELGSVSSKTKACLSFILSGANVIGVHVDGQCCSFEVDKKDVIYLTNEPYDLYINGNGVATGTCKFYFSGGTGKYKNASGSFDGYIENNLMGTFTVTVDGQISM